jgi:16S rRNA (cytosine1402-N4)-methyltransferase
MNFPHYSVLLHELLEFFRDRPLKYFVDGTLGAGGHSEAILKEHPEIELLIGIDQDPRARQIAQERLSSWKEKASIIPGNFADVKQHLSALGIQKVDGIILDLGVSSMQFDLPEKGFSFMREGPLDMRMDPTKSLTAAEVVNTWSEQDLGRIFREYGEEKFWRMAVRAIAAKRKEKPLETTIELADLLRQSLPFNKKGIHPATLIFQALRICVNRELEVLESALPDAIELLSPGGLLGVISFHSLEDRIVKNTMRFAASDKYDTAGIGGVFLDKEPTINLITRKPIIPCEEEIAINPRSRSAKLRVAEKR